MYGNLVPGNTTINEIMVPIVSNDFLHSHTFRWIHVAGRCLALVGMYERLDELLKQTQRKVVGKCLVSRAE